MYCIAMLDSGNYVFSLCGVLERKGYVFEVVSTPCAIAKDGCGYCLKFPCEYGSMVSNEAEALGFKIRAMYRIIPSITKNTYERIC